MASTICWLDGITAVGVVIFGIVVGIFSYYKSRKLEQKLLKYFGIMIVCVGLLYLGPSIDFLSIFFTGNNMDNSFGLYGILCYMWVAPGLIFAMYLGAVLIAPEKKTYILVFYMILGIIFEIFLFLDTEGTFTYDYPAIPGEDLIKSHLNLTSPAFILIVIFLLSVLFFNGFGALYRAIQSTGELRKKFLYISFGFFLFCICSIFNAFLEDVLFFVVNMGMIIYTVLLYIGVK